MLFHPIVEKAVEKLFWNKIRHLTTERGQRILDILCPLSCSMGNCATVSVPLSPVGIFYSVTGYSAADVFSFAAWLSLVSVSTAG